MPKYLFLQGVCWGCIMAEPSFQLSQRWGARGKDILEAGKGGGFVALPYMLDDYEKALGLEPLEMWLLKRLLRNYWNADDIFPSFRKIARQAKISVPTLRKIRRQLEAKGFIQMTGRKGTTKGAPDNRLTIDMRPLFFALWICILCDPQSKLAKRQRHAQIREELTETLGNDVDLYSWYVGKHVVKDLPLPLDVKIAKAAADKAGITLDWETISQMQGQAAQAIAPDRVVAAVRFAFLSSGLLAVGGTALAAARGKVQERS